MLSSSPEVTPTQEIHDCVVVGMGAMGSAATYHLAKRGLRVLGLEQFNIPHTMGSSHGYSRIIRMAYFEDDRYIPLLRRSYELWFELEKLHGEKLFHQTGSMDMGPEDGEIVKRSVFSCDKHNLPYELLRGEEINTRFPAFQVPSNYVACFQPDGGFLVPEKCIVAYVEAAMKVGARVQARERMLSYRLREDGIVVVSTNKGEYLTKKLCVTAGAWASKLLPELQHLAQPERQVLGWFQPLPGEDLAKYKPDRLPVANIETSKGLFYYSFPMYQVPGVKVGCYHHFYEKVDPDTINREPTLQDEEQVRDVLRQFLPGANGPTMSLAACMFTNSPDEHFIIDTHPVLPQVVIAAGFSGHGFKFASVVGELLADLVIEGHTVPEANLFKMDRLRDLSKVRRLHDFVPQAKL